MACSDALAERVAEALGWDVKDVHSFSARMLVEILREKHPKLAQLVRDEIESGANIFVKVPDPRYKRGCSKR